MKKSFQGFLGIRRLFIPGVFSSFARAQWANVKRLSVSARAVAAAFLVTAIALPVFAVSASATGSLTGPTFYPGNVTTCADLYNTYHIADQTLLSDTSWPTSPDNASHTLIDGTSSIVGTVSGSSLTITATGKYVIDYVNVKGGNGGNGQGSNVYKGPASNFTQSGLVAPNGFSHWFVCFHSSTPTTTTTKIQLSTDQSTVTTVPLGATVNDFATVTGTGNVAPTGTVAFTFYSTVDCSGTGVNAGTASLNSSGNAVSNNEGPLTAGSYSFQANYSGDNNNAPSTGACEPLTVSKAASSTVTTVKNGSTSVTNNVPLDSTITDSASVAGTGAGTPTGSVTFTFFITGTCTGTSTAGSAIVLDNFGTATSAAQTLPNAGHYSFQAVYSGDTNYNTSTGSCEPFTVGTGLANVVTNVQFDSNPITTVPLGSTVNDRAVVTGSGTATPTGTVSFTFFTNGICTGTSTAAGTAIALSSGVALSTNQGPLDAGSYSFQATYNGDTNYSGTTTGACEPFDVSKADSSTVTTIKQGESTVVAVDAQSTVTDTAAVTGTGVIAPTGSVSFTFFTNTACTGTGTDAGTGALAPGSASSNPQGPLAAGNYAFQATYSGDSNYNGSTGTCEPLVVNRVASKTVTTVMNGEVAVATSVSLGSTIFDTATVRANTGTPTGSVSFTFYSSGDCSGTGVSAGNVALDANGAASSSFEGPLAAGNYSFKATYSGDSTYATSSGSCEPFSVNQAQSATTTVVQIDGTTVTSVGFNSTVNDQATVMGTAGIVPTGTVSFAFYSNGMCSGEPINVTQGTLDGSAVATSGFEGPLAAGSYSFQATYAGDSNYTGSTGSCEPLTVSPVVTTTPPTTTPPTTTPPTTTPPTTTPPTTTPPTVPSTTITVAPPTVPSTTITVAPPTVPSTQITVSPPTIAPVTIPKGGPKTGLGGTASYLNEGRVFTGSGLVIFAGLALMALALRRRRRA